MNFKLNILFISIFLLSCHLRAQNNSISKKLKSNVSFTQKGTHWLDLNLGLSFMDSNFAGFEDPLLLTNENRRNFGFILQPKFQVFIDDKLSVGFHLGLAFDEFENKDINFQQNKNNYFAGLQGQYYFINLKNVLYISSELDVGLHYLENKFRFPSAEISDSYYTYFKSGFHINLTFMINNDFVFYAKFNDLLSYTDSENNFFGFDKGLQINNSLDNFISFPQFGFMLKLF